MLQIEEVPIPQENEKISKSLKKIKHQPICIQQVSSEHLQEMNEEKNKESDIQDITNTTNKELESPEKNQNLNLLREEEVNENKIKEEKSSTRYYFMESQTGEQVEANAAVINSLYQEIQRLISVKFFCLKGLKKNKKFFLWTIIIIFFVEEKKWD